MIMDPEMIIHDAIMILYQAKIDNRELQEYILKRYMIPNKVKQLDEILKLYGFSYDCDLEELRKKVKEDLDNDMFKLL